MNTNYITIDDRKIPIEGERNLLEVIRKANIELPTFCYHSDLSVYGACRLCLVEVEGRGINAACSTPVEANLVVRTQTDEIREIRKTNIELLLANHEQKCPTCVKSSSCSLLKIARTLGVDEVPYKPTHSKLPIDKSSDSIVRDPNKCVLCGDCVRACAEIQGVGAIEFAYRGAKSTVTTPFNKDLNRIECVNCGQCAVVCPTGALSIRQQVSDVQKVLNTKGKKVIAQIAPAVRVALGEYYGYKPGALSTGQIVAALKMMGFDQVYDTCFTADLTVIEEANEFLRRIENKDPLPMFTSCCPSWVKYAEQYYPGLLDNLSSCKSPQQMFGSLAKDILPEKFGIKREDLVVVSIMPCTAKKMEAKQEKFKTNGQPDVDYVITTQELYQMIESAGICFDKLQPESIDMPLGFKTGAGVIFGTTGGVTEAVLRYAVEKVSGATLENVEFKSVRGEEGIREAVVKVGNKTIRCAVAHGLKNAKKIAESVAKGENNYDIIEIMACPFGCVGGAGQPIPKNTDVKRMRAQGIYNADKMLDLHKSQENYLINECYEKHLGCVGGPKAHHLLHTDYASRKRTIQSGISLIDGEGENKITMNVCVGTSCFLRGAQNLVKALTGYVYEHQIADKVNLGVTFCRERCDKGPTVCIEDQTIEHCDFNKAVAALKSELYKTGNSETKKNEEQESVAVK